VASSREPWSAMPSAVDIAGPISDERAKRRVATYQAILRRVNDALRPDHGEDIVALRCECGQLGCKELIMLSRAEHMAVRAHPRRFAIAPAHAVDEIEHTVERHERYAVVEAHDPVAIAVADHTSQHQRSDG
jgi:hypothetical protein